MILRRFEFDYLGEHAQLDAFIMNASVKLFEHGLHVSSGLRSGHIFIQWSDISNITCTNEKQALIEISSSDGAIKLQKIKKETDLNKLKQLLRQTVPDIEIENTPSQPEIVKSLELARSSKSYKEQELRIQHFVSKNEANNERELLKAWRQHLIDTLALPFEAEIPEGSPYLRKGETITVLKLGDIDDLYGTLACLKKGRKKFWYPLCDLEAVVKESDHFGMLMIILFGIAIGKSLPIAVLPLPVNIG